MDSTSRDGATRDHSKEETETQLVDIIANQLISLGYRPIARTIDAGKRGVFIAAPGEDGGAFIITASKVSGAHIELIEKAQQGG